MAGGVRPVVQDIAKVVTFGACTVSAAAVHKGLYEGLKGVRYEVADKGMHGESCIDDSPLAGCSVKKS